MRPMAVLIGIIMGSAVALTVSLSMSAVVFVLLPEYQRVRLASELYCRCCCAGTAMVLEPGGGGLGELRGRIAAAALALVTEAVLAAPLTALLIVYWPVDPPVAQPLPAGDGLITLSAR